MTHVYFDASALARRYTHEPGAAEVNHVFGRVWPDRMHLLAVGVGEGLSVLVRRRNRGQLPPAAYHQTEAAFRAEVVDEPAVDQVEADRATVRASLTFIGQYSVNATDALVLRTALDLKAELAPAGDDLILVASDRQLNRAAAAEGLPTFDPERQTAADFDALFTP